MNSRQRFRETLLFGNPDKVPLSPGGPRESTREAWRQQGLPADVNWWVYLLKKLVLNLKFNKIKLIPVFPLK